MNRLPVTGQGATSAVSDLGTTTPPPERPAADVRSVTPDYLHTMGIPLRAGRWLEPADAQRHVAVVSVDLASRAWPGADPLGRRFQFGSAGTGDVYEVVGVAGAVRNITLDRSTISAYVPFPQQAGAAVAVAVKVDGDATALAAPVRSLVREIDPQMPIGAIRTMDDVIDGSLSHRRFQLQLLIIFAATATLLAGIGVYGVVAHSVAQRTNEIGIRMALGASPRRVAAMVLCQGLLPVAAGLLAAVPASLAIASRLDTLLFGVAPHDLATLLSVGLIVSITAVAATYWPARRATRVGPMVALRCQ
jgi:predicted permease